MDGHTYVRTDGRTDGHLRRALLGRLCRRVDLIMTGGQRIMAKSRVQEGRISHEGQSETD